MRILTLFLMIFFFFSIFAVDFAAGGEAKDISHELRYKEVILENCDATVVKKMDDDHFTIPKRTPLIVGLGDLKGAGRLFLENSSNEYQTKLLSIEFVHFQVLDIIISSLNQYNRYTYKDSHRYHYPHSVFPVFPITLAPGERAVVNFYVENDGQFRFPIFLRSSHNFLQNLAQRDVLTWALLGFMLAFVLLNLLNAPILANKLLFHHAIFMLAFIMLLFHDYGYARIVFWGDDPVTTVFATRVTQGVLGLFGVLFADTFFRQFSPPSFVKWWYKIFLWITIVVIIVTPFVSNWKMLMINLYVTIGTLIFTTAIAIYSARKGYTAAFYFLVGWICIAIGAISYFLTSTGNLPYTFYTTHSMQIGASLGFIVFSLMLTNRLKRAIEMQLETQKKSLTDLEKADQLLEQFVSTISHEIRTPLNGILGYISLIKPTSKQQKSVVEFIGNSARRLSLLLSSILDLKEFFKGDKKEDIVCFDAVELLKDVSRLMRPFIHQNNSSIAISNNTDSFVIEGNQSLFMKVFVGLIFNVIHHAPASSIMIVISKDKDNGTIVVKDNGPGIIPETVTNIKEIFTQKAEQCSVRNNMTSVNFSEISLMVEALNGTIDISSELGYGTTVSITFSEVDKKEVTEYPLLNDFTVESHGVTSDKSRPILVVDDEPINLKILTAFLTQENYEVEVASNGEEVREVLRRRTPGLILMDIMLPDDNGIELAREIRQKYDRFAMPLLFVSAKSEPSVIKDAYESGGNGFVVKPIDRTILMHEVKMWMEISEKRAGRG